MGLTRFNKFSISVKYMLIQHMFNLISGVFIGAMVARHYGPELFGVFSLSWFYVSAVGVVSSLGTNDLLAAQCIKKPSIKEGLFWAVLFIRSLTYLLFAALGYVVLKSFDVSDIVLRGYGFGLLAGVLHNINLFNVIAKSEQRNDKIAQIAIISLLASIVFRVYIVSSNKTLDYLYWNCALVSVVDLVLMIVYLRREHMLYSFSRPNWRGAFELIRNSAPLAVGGIATMIGANLGLILLSEMTGLDSTGRYAVVLKLYTFLAFISYVIHSNLFYYMESSGLNAEKFIGEHLRVIVKSVAALSCLVIIGSFVILSPLLEILYGNQYSGVGLKFSIASISFVFGWSMIPAQIKLLSEKRTGRVMTIDFLVLAFNLCGAYILISLYGEWGAYLLMPISAFMLMLINYYCSGLGGQVKHVILWILFPIPSKKALKDFTRH